MSCIYKYKGKDYTKEEFYSLVRTTMIQPRTVQKYEKVLFPRLDTIIQIESKGKFKTYAEAEANYKNERWKLEDEELRKTLKEYQEELENRKIAKKDTKGIEQAIINQKERIRSHQPTLLNTANFYEYELANRLDDIVGGNKNNRAKGIWVLNKITDEYGNTWNEVVLDNNSNKSILFNNVSNKSESELKESINNKLLEFAKINGINVKFVNSLQDKYKNDPAAAVDVINKLIQINQNKADANVLPEELAHILTYGLADSDILTQRALNLVGRYGVQNILGEEYDKYFTFYKGDENLLRHEALGKLIAQAISTDFKVVPTEETEFKLFDTIKRLFDKFVKLFKPNDNIINQLNKDVKDLASKITNAEKITALESMSKTKPNSDMYNLGNTKSKIPDNLKKQHAFLKTSLYNKKSLLNRYKKQAEKSNDEILNKNILFLKQDIDKSIKILNELESTGDKQKLINFANETMDYISNWINTIEITNPDKVSYNNIEHIRETLLVFEEFPEMDVDSVAERARSLHTRLKPIISDFAFKQAKKVYPELNKSNFDAMQRDIFAGRKYFGTLTDVNNYIAATAGYKIKEAQNDIALDNRSFEDKLNAELDLLTAYAKSNNINLKDIYTPFIQKLNGTTVLTKEYTSEYYDLLKQAYKETNTQTRNSKLKSFAVWNSLERKWEPRDPKYHNSNYSKIKSTPELNRFYEYFKKTVSDLLEELPVDNIGSNFIPNAVEQTLLDVINSEEDLMSKFKSSVGYITDVYLQDISDTKPIYDEGLYPDKIPLRYIAKVDAEKKSNDLGRSLLKFAHFVNSYKHMNEVLPYTKLLKGQLADSKMVNNLNPKVEIQGNNSNAYVILDKFIEMQVLGRKKNVELVNTPVGSIRFDKLADFGLKYTSLLRIGLNPFNAVTNVVIGRIGNIIESYGGRFFNRKEYLKATNIYYSQIIDENSKLHKLIKTFNPLMELEDYEQVEKIGIGYLNSKKYQDKVKSLLYSPQKAGENYLQSSVMIAMLLHDKITSNSGQEVSIWDAFDENGNWKTEEFGELTKDAIFKRSSKIQAVNRSIHGRYSEKDAAIITQNSLWRIAFQFKKFLPAAIESRFQARRFDPTLGVEVEGRYLLVFKMYKHMIAKFKQDTANIELTKMDATDIYNLKKNLSELVIFLGIMTAALMLGGAGDDDKKLKSNGMYKYTMTQLDRVSGDLLFFLNPAEANRSLFRALPLNKTISDVNTAIWNLGHLTGLTDEPTYKKGFRKGENKGLATLADITPVIKPIVDLWRTSKDDVAYTEPYSR